MVELISFPKAQPLFGEHKLFPRTPLREWIREYVPSPKEGYVAEDLDLIFLRYGEAIKRNKDADGQFILCEWKLGRGQLPYSQVRVFGLIDRLLRQADPMSEFYQGFYHISWDGESNDLLVNKEKITQQEFQMFLMGKLFIKPLRFKEVE